MSSKVSSATSSAAASLISSAVSEISSVSSAYLLFTVLLADVALKASSSSFAASALDAFATRAASIIASLRSDINISILSYLSSAFFCVAFLIIPSNPLVILGLYCFISGSSSFKCLSAIAIELLASKGTLPVTISYIVIPREYISLFSLTYPPLACSGEK